MAAQRWMSQLAVSGLVIAGVYSLAKLAVRSAAPGSYYRFRHSAEGFTYPTESVVTWSAVIAVELAISVFILLRTKSVPSMCLVLGLLYGLGLLSLGVFAMHAPPYFGGHLVFLLFGG